MYVSFLVDTAQQGYHTTDSMSTPTTVPLHEVCGYAPGGIPAYSNGNDELFTNTSNYMEHLFVGYKWQCVEFARRWLLLRKGLILPEYHFAAHIIYGNEVMTLEGKHVRALVVRNGTSKEPPLADSLIIYPSTKKNFVGHVGVITEVGADYVRVADQNRFFHHWGSKSYSAQFSLQKRDDGTYYIDDPVVACSGWISFPNFPNRPDGAPVTIPTAIKAPPRAWFPSHLRFVWLGIKEHFCGLPKAEEEPKASINHAKGSGGWCGGNADADVAPKQSSKEE